MPYYYSLSAMRQVAINESFKRYSTANSYTYGQVLAEKVSDKHPSPGTVFDIFLSYRTDDSDVVGGVYDDLVRRGYRVYLDRVMDPQLDRTKVTKDTADVLRNRLIHSKSLFYTATENAAKSTWMPWELGFQDGYRNKSAIVPVTEGGTSQFTGVEFVAIYPRVVPITPTSLAIVEPDLTFINNFEGWRDSLPKRKCGMPKCPLPSS